MSLTLYRALCSLLSCVLHSSFALISWSSISLTICFVFMVNKLFHTEWCVKACRCDVKRVTLMRRATSWYTTSLSTPSRSMALCSSAAKLLSSSVNSRSWPPASYTHCCTITSSKRQTENLVNVSLHWLPQLSISDHACLCYNEGTQLFIVSCSVLLGGYFNCGYVNRPVDKKRVAHNEKAFSPRDQALHFMYRCKMPKTCKMPKACLSVTD